MFTVYISTLYHYGVKSHCYRTRSGNIVNEQILLVVKQRYNFIFTTSRQVLKINFNYFIKIQIITKIFIVLINNLIIFKAFYEHDIFFKTNKTKNKKKTNCNTGYSCCCCFNNTTITNNINNNNNKQCVY